MVHANSIQNLDQTTHGATCGDAHTPEYMAWRAMKLRCRNQKDKRFADYGGRGITICDRWLGKHGFSNFLTDLGAKPSPLHSLDRIDNDGNYEPGNCRWATKTQQGRNTRVNRLVTFRGETMCLAAWAEKLGIRYVTIRNRLRLGWTIERAFTTPPRCSQ